MICERLLQLCNRSHVPSPGLKHNSCRESPTCAQTSICFQLQQSEPFANHFYAASPSPPASACNGNSDCSPAVSMPSTRNSSSTSGAQGNNKLPASNSSSPDTMQTDVSESRQGTSCSITSTRSKLSSCGSLSSLHNDGAVAPVEELGLERQPPLERMMDVHKILRSNSADDSLTGDSSTARVEQAWPVRRKKLPSPPPVTRMKSFAEVKELLRRASELMKQEDVEEVQLTAKGCNEDVSEAPIEQVTEHEPSLSSAQVAAILTQEYQVQTANFFLHFFRYQHDINSSPTAWDRLAHEGDAEILAALLWLWIESLQEPVIDSETIVHIVLKAEKPIDALMKLDKNARFLIEYLIRFLARLRPDSDPQLDLLLRRLIAGITHQRIRVGKGAEREAVARAVPAETGERGKSRKFLPGPRENWPQMRKGTTERAVTFFKAFYQLLCSSALPEAWPAAP